jgi:hypothetical protein
LKEGGIRVTNSASEKKIVTMPNLSKEKLITPGFTTPSPGNRFVEQMDALQREQVVTNKTLPVIQPTPMPLTTPPPPSLVVPLYETAEQRQRRETSEATIFKLPQKPLPELESLDDEEDEAEINTDNNNNNNNNMNTAQTLPSLTLLDQTDDDEIASEASSISDYLPAIPVKMTKKLIKVSDKTAVGENSGSEVESGKNSMDLSEESNENSGVLKKPSVNFRPPKGKLFTTHPYYYYTNFGGVVVG